MSEDEAEMEKGRQALKEWYKTAKWLPKDFIEKATVESVELVVCERRFKNELIVTESTHELTLSQIKYEEYKKSLSKNKYSERYTLYPKNEWGGGELVFEVPNSHSQSRCPECSGSGKVPCHICNSTGRMQCLQCNGSGVNEDTRACPKCQGLGELSEDEHIYEYSDNWEKETYVVRDLQCDRCFGEGIEYINTGCDFCNGKGEFPCTDCSKSGLTLCDVCDGEGLVHKTRVLKREYTPRTSMNLISHSIPKELIRGIEGMNEKVEEGETSRERPKHEIIVREIPVLKVNYTYKNKPLIFGSEKENRYTLYRVGGNFESLDYPKSKMRRLWPFILIVFFLTVILTGINLLML